MLDVDNIRLQIEKGKTVDSVYRCCGQEFATLYEFRKHLYEEHPEEYAELGSEVFHRDIPKVVHVKGSKRKINQRKKSSRGKSDHSFSIYKTNSRPISIPMGGSGKKK